MKTVRRANLFNFANGLKSETLPAGHGSHVKKHDTRLRIGRIDFSTREKKRYATFDWLFAT